MEAGKQKTIRHPCLAMEYTGPTGSVQGLISMPGNIPFALPAQKGKVFPQAFRRTKAHGVEGAIRYIC